MKLRIITDGHHFKIQAKELFCWGMMSTNGRVDEDYADDAEFCSEDEARDWIRERFGLDGIRSIQDNEWRPL